MSAGGSQGHSGWQERSRAMLPVLRTSQAAKVDAARGRLTGEAGGAGAQRTHKELEQQKSHWRVLSASFTPSFSSASPFPGDPGIYLHVTSHARTKARKQPSLMHVHRPCRLGGQKRQLSSSQGLRLEPRGQRRPGRGASLFPPRCQAGMAGGWAQQGLLIRMPACSTPA